MWTLSEVDSLRGQVMDEMRSSGSLRPNTERKVAELFRDFRAKNLPRNTLVSAMHTFGEAHFLESEGDIESRLHDPDRIIREMAASVLGLHWRSERHAGALSSCAVSTEEDEYVRVTAIAGLGSIFGGSRNVSILRLLMELLRSSTQEGIPGSAYQSILYVWHPPESWKETTFPFEKDLDENLLSTVATYIRDNQGQE